MTGERRTAGKKRITTRSKIIQPSPEKARTRDKTRSEVPVIMALFLYLNLLTSPLRPLAARFPVPIAVNTDITQVQPVPLAGTTSLSDTGASSTVFLLELPVSMTMTTMGSTTTSMSKATIDDIVKQIMLVFLVISCPPLIPKELEESVSWLEESEAMGNLLWTRAPPSPWTRWGWIPFTLLWWRAIVWVGNPGDNRSLTPRNPSARNWSSQFSAAKRGFSKIFIKLRTRVNFSVSFVLFVRALYWKPEKIKEFISNSQVALIAVFEHWMWRQRFKKATDALAFYFKRKMTFLM